MPETTLLKAAGYGSFLVAIKHALTGKQFHRLPQFQDLPNLANTCSTHPELLREPMSRAMAALIVSIAWSSSAWSSSAWYLRRAIKASGFLTATAGILQAYAALY
ncbi:uncharacterized protein N7473_012409 [Penicillium subrubescens]|uniref:uncharacterized protein n=1 Tax=Penicillium subrubescens TaxID=1316194 RepID=UPI0025450C32|nr:uncharacterized protein N7473_012409 [Penicillium subrubescens]KAJ5875062.1 hypothetical protein N7473_012409 [Penicillium subrubescens]